MGRVQPLRALIDQRYPDAPWGTCRWCGRPILKKDGTQNLRRRWHPDCHEEMLSFDPRVLRDKVSDRDHGVCAACGFDCHLAERQMRQEYSRARAGLRDGPDIGRTLRAVGFDLTRSLWDMDHVVPLADGGGHALEWVWTLCQVCHKKKTALEATLRARGYTPEQDPEAAKARWRSELCRRPQT